jgi:acetyl esterase
VLDPEMRVFLEALQGKPSLETMALDAARRAFQLLFKYDTKAEVLSVENRLIPGPQGDIPLRIYQPFGKAPWPVLVYFHGGGWVLGDIETYDATMRLLCQKGILVIAVDYRLAPEHPYPAAIEDCYAAVLWVSEHGESLGGDVSRLAVGGDSAGGNLAAVVTLMAKEQQKPTIDKQLLLYPATDAGSMAPSIFDNGEGYFLTLPLMRWFFRHYTKGVDVHWSEPTISPLRAKNMRDLPRALIMTAEYDPLRDEGEVYAAKLRAFGVPAVCTRYQGAIHAFFHPRFGAGKQAIAAAASFLVER